MVDQGSSRDAVSASELVRNFGVWRDRASRTPVSILHHGRPRLMLASLEHFHRWTGQSAAADSDLLEALFDALAEPSLLIDRDGRIIAAGRPARSVFGPGVASDVLLDDAFPGAVADYLSGLAGRVAATGLRELGELPAAAGQAGRLELVCEPCGEHVLINARSAAAGDARDAALGQVQALAAAVAALPGTAIATIGVRGQLLTTSETLAELAGVNPRALGGIRAVSIFAVGSRVMVGEAIERVFSGEGPVYVEADLMTDGGETLPVGLGLAPLRHCLSIVGVVAAIQSRGS